MSEPQYPDRPTADDSESESVSAPYRGGDAPRRERTPALWVAVLVLGAVAVGALLAALGIGMLD
jgi:hypothetical protein